MADMAIWLQAPVSSECEVALFTRGRMTRGGIEILMQYLRIAHRRSPRDEPANRSWLTMLEAHDAPQTD